MSKGLIGESRIEAAGLALTVGTSALVVIPAQAGILKLCLICGLEPTPTQNLSQKEHVIFI
ncbi:MAG TPA: hypothetical protein DCX92_00700 [Bacteroidetes bacterium]|nr:hypothetical protein [Bacteroidota bacterium]